jgi:hypothetical protein
MFPRRFVRGFWMVGLVVRSFERLAWGSHRGLRNTPLRPTIAVKQKRMKTAWAVSSKMDDHRELLCFLSYHVAYRSIAQYFVSD